MNPLRVKRQYEVKRRLSNSVHLDIGSGSFPISNRAITVDIQSNKKPTITANALSIPLPDSFADTITALEIIEHFHKPEQSKFILELKRLLKPNGLLIISLPNSTPFMSIPQRLVWTIREYTTQREYHNNSHTHTHIGLITPNQLIELLRKYKFKIIESKRLMLYDYLIQATKTT